jgi:peptidoglycan/LPS O-acetylase OafA/YrhL
LAVFVAFSHIVGHILGWDQALKNTGFAVDIFFVISGIVLYRSYVERGGGRIQRIGRLITNRFFRLWPLYALTTVSVYAIWLFAPSAKLPSWISLEADRDLVLNLLFVNNGLGLDTVRSLNHPTWSISIEFWLGILFISIAIFSKTLGITLGLSVAATIFMMGLLDPAYVDNKVSGTFLSFGVVRCLLGMSLGALAMALYKFIKPASGVVLFLTSGSIGIIGLNISSNETASSIASLGYLAFASFGLVLLGHSKRTSFLDFPALRLLGKYSYSIYLVHIPVVYVILIINPQPQGRAQDLVVLALFLTYLVSATTYHLVELPGIRLGRKVSRIKSDTT